MRPLLRRAGAGRGGTRLREGEAAAPGHSVAGGRLVCARLRADGPRPARGRDHLVRRDPDRRGPPATPRRGHAGSCARRARAARTRSGCTGSGPLISRTCRRSLRRSRRCCARSPGGVLVAHTAAIERAFLGRALRAQGLRLRGPIVDTEVLGRLWLHDRDGIPATARVADRPGRRARPAGRAAARRARRRADDRAGVHRARRAPGLGARRDRRHPVAGLTAA